MGIVPELAVTDWRGSQQFYLTVLGFHVVYERDEEGFALLRREGAELMIDEIGRGRTFVPDGASLDPPLGQGMNLEIPARSIDPLVTALRDAGVSLHLPLEEKWYRGGGAEHGVRQFVVSDPDGYLLRFSQSLGQRPGR